MQLCETFMQLQNPYLNKNYIPQSYMFSLTLFLVFISIIGGHEPN